MEGKKYVDYEDEESVHEIKNKRREKKTDRLSVMWHEGYVRRKKKQKQ